MKKKVLSMILAAVMTLALAACGDTGNDGSGATGQGSDSVGQESGDSTGQDGETKSFKVTFYDADGTTVLSEEEVAEGASPTEYTPEKEGHTAV